MGTPIVTVFILGLVFLAKVGFADQSADSQPFRIPPIVITPNRIEQSSFDLPVSIDVLDADRIQNEQPQINLSESLARVPGVVAQNRQNYAQDLQISVRGFGARSTFGVRGVRLLSDDMPATSPDGQGQAATFDLSTVRRVEIMRGPFSSLYGNSSGGVIAVFTEDGPNVPTIATDVADGSFGTSKFGMKFGEESKPVNFIGHFSRFDTHGYREHSAATRDQFNSKFSLRLNEDTSLTFVATALHQPDTQDPLGLTRAQADADPRAAGSNAILFDTRKSIQHYQVGWIYEHALDPQNILRLLGYLGNRNVVQFLAVPLATQQGALHSGGVVDLDRQFGGVDARFTHKTSLSGGPLTITSGISYDNQEERRKGFINDFGAVGDLKRDEDDRVYSLDEYVQAEWHFVPRSTITFGLRHSEVRFKSTDYFIVGANADDSGVVRYDATNPVVGVLFKVTPTVNVYANAGRGFETPTFAEIAYKTDGTSGLNFALRPSTSRNLEIGTKVLLGSDARLNIAIFRIDTKDEIVVASNVGGRTAFQNAGQTVRRGVEVSAESGFAGGFSAYTAITFINAVYDESFSTCTSAPPCVIPSIIQGGNKIPGVPARTAYGEFSWKDKSGRFSTALEARWSDKVFVNDANTEVADAYTTVNWRAGFSQRGSHWELSEFLRIDNIFDRRYIGSVIVNASGGQFYEPAPGRNYFIGARAQYRF